ncbi:hypothetical protein ACFL21_02560 [Patescibacteria group bacterium]
MNSKHLSIEEGRSALGEVVELIDSSKSKDINDERETILNRVNILLVNILFHSMVPLSEVSHILGATLEVNTRRRLTEINIKSVLDGLREEHPEITVNFEETENREQRLETLIDKIPLIKLKQTLVPPDEQEMNLGEGTNEFEKRALIPRTRLALEVLEDLDVELCECKIFVGKNSKNMVRQLSYKMIVVYKLNKLILICDEEDNRTFVIDGTRRQKKYYCMTKEQLKKNSKVKDLIWNSDEDKWKKSLAKLLVNEEMQEAPPTGWMSLMEAAEFIGTTSTYLTPRVKKYRESNPEYFVEFRNSVNGRIFTYLSPKLIEIIKKEYERFPYPPEGWMNLSDISKLVPVTRSGLKPIIKKCSKSNPEWIKRYRNPERNNVLTYYSPELVKIIKSEFSNIETAPEGWMMVTVLHNNYSQISSKTIYRVAAEYHEEHPESIKEFWHDEYNRLERYMSPELVKYIIDTYADIPLAPEGWENTASLAINISRTNATVDRCVNEYIAEHPEWFKIFKHPESGLYLQYYSPELVDIVVNALSFKNPPEGWLRITEIYLLLSDKGYHRFLKKILEDIVNENPELHGIYHDSINRPRSFYSPDLLKELKHRYEALITESQAISTDELIVNAKNSKESKSNIPGFENYFDDAEKVRKDLNEFLIALKGERTIFDLNANTMRSIRIICCNGKEVRGMTYLSYAVKVIFNVWKQTEVSRLHTKVLLKLKETAEIVLRDKNYYENSENIKFDLTSFARATGEDINIEELKPHMMRDLVCECKNGELVNFRQYLVDAGKELRSYKSSKESIPHITETFKYLLDFIR